MRWWTRRSPILSLDTPEGSAARATGIVRGSAALLSPWSGQPCVAYHVVIPMVGESTPFEASELSAFALEGEGIQVSVVDPFFVLRGFAPQRAAAAAATDRWRDYLSEHGLSPETIGLPEEFIVEVGVHVTVTGLAARSVVAPTREVGFRETASALRLVGDFDQPLHIDLVRR